ncbi:hypothetical protein VNO77_33587 [Canavalia gladiata]|uniref:Uncharacterized protein n=1 Tax=Canavalia gladiata TaxID=3824 RepID=A0AAN9KC39_CANGL
MEMNTFPYPTKISACPFGLSLPLPLNLDCLIASCIWSRIHFCDLSSQGWALDTFGLENGQPLESDVNELQSDLFVHVCRWFNEVLLLDFTTAMMEEGNGLLNMPCIPMREVNSDEVWNIRQREDDGHGIQRLQDKLSLNGTDCGRIGESSSPFRTAAGMACSSRDPVETASACVESLKFE